MFEFRVYLLDDIERVLKTCTFESVDEAAARKRAREIWCRDYTLELWRGLDRLERIEAEVSERDRREGPIAA